MAAFNQFQLAQSFVHSITRNEKGHYIGDKFSFESQQDSTQLLLSRLDGESLYVSGAPGSGKTTFCYWSLS